MNITEEKLLEYLSKALVCVAVIVIGYIITRLIIGILRKILNKSRMDGTAEGFVLSVLKVIFYFIVAVTALGTIGVNVASLITALGAAALTAGSCITGFAEKCCQRTCNFDKQTVCVG
jgi:small conductance mechanosensitive channel